MREKDIDDINSILLSPGLNRSVANTSRTQLHFQEARNMLCRKRKIKPALPSHANCRNRKRFSVMCTTVDAVNKFHFDKSSRIEHFHA